MTKDTQDMPEEIFIDHVKKSETGFYSARADTNWGEVKYIRADLVMPPQTKILVEALRNCSTEFFKIGDMNMVYEIDLIIDAHSKGI